MTHLELNEVLSSRLLSPEEVGELAKLTDTFRANLNGGAHARLGAKSVSAKATGTQVMTIGEFREAGSFGNCRKCGDGK